MKKNEEKMEKTKMMTSKQVRNKMTVYLSDVTFFTTVELKEMLNKMGCVYNKDYEVNAFSNAIAYLAKKNYIVSTGEKGAYRVVDPKFGAQTTDKNSTNKFEQELDMDTERNMKNTNSNEIEVKEARNIIKDYLKTYHKQIEGVLDSVKPSVFGRNKKTYDDILRLIEFIEKFSFTVDK